MNKKIIIIISAIIIIVSVCAVFYIFQQNSKKSVESDSGNVSIKIAKGAEKDTKIIQPAVEAYLSQNVSETIASRSKRLSAYFTSDSPVLSRDIEIRSINSAVKTKGSLTSVSFIAGESQLPTLIVKADVTSYAGSNSNTVSQTYWVSMKNNSMKVLKAYDIGLMDQ